MHVKAGGMCSYRIGGAVAVAVLMIGASAARADDVMVPAQVQAAPAAVKLPDPVSFGIALELGDVGSARKWLDAGLPADFLADRIGTGLMIAAWEGNIPLMEIFLAHGADVNAVNRVGEQAIMLAAWRGHGKAMQWLLDHGAELKRAPLHWTALHYAALAGKGELVRQLIDRGAELDARTPAGASALMLAVYDGHDAVARQLVEAGADRGVRNDRGESALDWAMRANNLKLARVVAEPQALAKAVSRPRAQWKPLPRSEPAPAEIVQLFEVRKILQQRGMSLDEVDRRIAAARAKYARADRVHAPAADHAQTTLEIRARRDAPQDQDVRLLKTPSP